MTSSDAKASGTSSRLATKGGSSRSGSRSPKNATPKPPATPGVARIIAIANQKGGVGKSTTAVSLGAALADLGYRVLVVDLDPQGNASTGMGIRHEARETTVYHVIVAESPIDDAIVPTAVAGLDAVPSTIDLAGAEIELVSQFSREMRLKKSLAPIREGRYDFVLIDCPPSLGLLTINALTAAEELVVPIQCEYYALEGLGQLLRNVSLVQQNINPGLRLSGIVMTMYDPRTKLSEQVVEEVQRFFGDLVYDVIIPRTVRLSEAPGFGQPITVYDPRSKGADTYRRLAAEVARRPPPAEPMPVYDDLPLVVMAPMEGPVAAEPPREAPLEDLPVPTVHELLEEVELEHEAEAPEMQTRPPEADADTGAPPPVEPRPSPERPSPGSATETVHEPVPPAVTRPVERAPQPVEDDEDVWEDADGPAPTGRAPRPNVTPAPPTNLPERRVVVIDEDAEFRTPSRPDPRGGAHDEPSTPPAVAAIGATLEEEAHGKRRWRLFRKGGE